MIMVVRFPALHQSAQFDLFPLI